jgi:hypothetical protein
MTICSLAWMQWYCLNRLNHKNQLRQNLYPQCQLFSKRSNWTYISMRYYQLFYKLSNIQIIKIQFFLPNFLGDFHRIDRIGDITEEQSWTGWETSGYFLILFLFSKILLSMLLSKLFWLLLRCTAHIILMFLSCYTVHISPSWIQILNLFPEWNADNDSTKGAPFSGNGTGNRSFVCDFRSMSV